MRFIAGYFESLSGILVVFDWCLAHFNKPFSGFVNPGRPKPFSSDGFWLTF